MTPVRATTERNQPDPRLTPRVRITILTGTLATIAALIGTLLPGITDFPSEHRWTTLGLAVAFASSERLVFHVEARNESVSYAPTEIALALGLLFFNPGELLAARLMGATVGMLMWRRPPLLKLAFNLAHFSLETMVAAGIFAATTALLGRETPMIAIALLLGLVTALTGGGIAVSAAIAQYEGDFEGRARSELRNAPLFHLPPAVVAASISVPITVEPWLGLLAIAPAPVVWHVVRRHGALLHRYADLTTVHDFSHLVGNARTLQDLADTAVERIAEAARAGQVAIRLWADDGSTIDATAGSTTLADLLPDTVEDPTWERVITSRSVLRLRADEPESPLGAGLAGHGIEEALVSAMGDDGTIDGVLLVADRQGATDAFDDDDHSRIETMVQQLAVAVRKARFHARIQFDATHDRLTGLPNRGYFETWVSEMAASGGAVLLIDLDRFKRANDSFGHRAGDLVLEATAERIRQVCTEAHLPARFGGDEFAVFAPGLAPPAATLLAERICDSLEEPVDIGSASISITASIGVAIAPDHATDATTLMRMADIAMYEAKRHRLRASLYRDDLEEDDENRLVLLADLRTAINNNTIDVHYQPQVELGTGRVCGMEALARWTHPEHGPIRPDIFVELAEQAGLIDRLTQNVLRQATGAAKQLQMRGWPLTVSVNISVLSLHDEKLEPLVIEQLGLSGLEPDQLTLEVTETTMMGDPERTHRILHRLANLGVRFSVDDFGTGHSSLVNLRHLPVSELKIDRSFVMDMLDRPDDEVIVQSTIDLGRNLGLTVVAEGVETPEIATRLQDLGCDIAQGFGISRPIPLDTLQAWLAEHHPDTRRRAARPSAQIHVATDRRAG